MRALRQALAQLSPEETLTVERLVGILRTLEFTGTVPLRFHRGQPKGFAAGREIEMAFEAPQRAVRQGDLTTGKG